MRGNGQNAGEEKEAERENLKGEPGDLILDPEVLVEEVKGRVQTRKTEKKTKDVNVNIVVMKIVNLMMTETVPEGLIGGIEEKESEVVVLLVPVIPAAVHPIKTAVFTTVSRATKVLTKELLVTLFL